MSKTAEKEIVFDTQEQALRILGKFDERLKLFEKEFNLKILPRGNALNLSGPPDQIDRMEGVLTELKGLLDEGVGISGTDIEYAIKTAGDRECTVRSLLTDVIHINPKGTRIRPKTVGQKQYVDAMRANDLVVGIGPAGTGKTYLAVAMAVHYLLNHKVARIVLARPAVEAGEKLGFLPGDYREKVNPYLRPVHDALFDMLTPEAYERLMEKELIETAPIAYMRGRTLNDAFIILDEAQNTTREQMKMFLTRMGSASKMVVQGDITQVDIDSHRNSGLVEIQTVLKNVPGIAFVHLTEADVMRHPLVSAIITMYQRRGQV
jgi:phosphate starvation-inducible protein PhoH and related proteins